MTYLGCILACFLAQAPAPTMTSETPATSPAAPAAVAELRPMGVRIRKMFLVRPDLLRYPVPYDVIC